MQLPEGRTCPTLSRFMDVHLLQVPSVVHLEVAPDPGDAPIQKSLRPGTFSREATQVSRQVEH